MKQSEQDIVDLDEVITSSEVEEEEEEKEESSNYAMDEYLSLLRKAAPMLGEVISPASDIKEYQEGIKQTLSGNLLGLPRAAAGLAGIFIPGSKYIREGGQKVSKIIDDKLKDLNTEEAITSYVIAPDKIDRTQLVNKINKDKNIQKKTDEFLNKKGFKEEDTIPIYRVITSNKPNEIIKDEKLISGSLDMKQHLNVFDEFKDKAQYTNVIRYDVPKKNIKVAMEAHKKDIKEKSNKIIKELGYGQNPISGKTIKDIQSEIMGGTKYVDKVENPAKRAKELIEKQGEVIVDVSNVPKKTITSRDAKNFLSNQGEVDLIKEGKIKTYDDYINYIISSQGVMYGGNRQLGQLAREALRGKPGASKKLEEIYKDILIEQADELTDFYNLPRLSIKKQGGMVMRSDNYNIQRAI